MYTVLIAEDELLVRMGIASSVPWVQMDMRVIAETSDGKNAWEAFNEHRPDIIITDIRMPGIDGLELIRRIRAVDNECAIIVITNVEHEATINETRRLGVAGFLLKATMKRDDIMHAVMLAKEKLPEGRGRNTIEEDNLDLWREYLTNPEMSVETFAQRCAQANASFFQPQGVVLMHVRHNEHLSFRLRSSLGQLFAHRLSATNDFCVVDVDNDTIAVARKSFDPLTMQRSLQELARYVSDNFDSTLYFVIRPDALPLEALRQGIDTARHFVHDAGYFDNPAVMLNPLGNPVFPELQQAVRNLHFCSLLAGQEGRYSICADKAMELPNALSVNWTTGKVVGKQILTELEASQDFSGMYSMINAIAYAAEKAVETLRPSVNAAVLEALDYIEAHISEKLSIQQIADVVGYHPSYFSNLFKRETGLSFSELLTILRIQCAKELLKAGNLTLQEIADRCGFSDLSYFSTKFKNATGMSPSKWRTKG